MFVATDTLPCALTLTAAWASPSGASAQSTPGTTPFSSRRPRSRRRRRSGERKGYCWRYCCCPCCCFCCVCCWQCLLPTMSLQSIELASKAMSHSHTSVSRHLIINVSTSCFQALGRVPVQGARHLLLLRRDGAVYEGTRRVSPIAQGQGSGSVVHQVGGILIIFFYISFWGKFR